MTQTKKYVGTSKGESGGFDGYAGLRLRKEYTAEERDGRMHIILPTGRPTSVTVEQWEAWFR